MSYTKKILNKLWINKNEDGRYEPWAFQPLSGIIAGIHEARLRKNYILLAVIIPLTLIVFPALLICSVIFLGLSIAATFLSLTFVSLFDVITSRGSPKVEESKQNSTPQQNTAASGSYVNEMTRLMTTPPKKPALAPNPTNAPPDYMTATLGRATQASLITDPFRFLAAKGIYADNTRTNMHGQTPLTATGQDGQSLDVGMMQTDQDGNIHLFGLHLTND